MLSCANNDILLIKIKSDVQIKQLKFGLPLRNDVILYNRSLHIFYSLENYGRCTEYLVTELNKPALSRGL